MSSPGKRRISLTNLKRSFNCLGIYYLQTQRPLKCGYFLLSTERIEKNQAHSEIANLDNFPIDYYQSNTGLAITAIIPAKLQSAPLSLRALSLY